MKNRSLLGIILLLAVSVSFSYSLAKAAVLHYYAGPDYYSPETMLLIELTDFNVTGPSPPKVGDTVKVEFKLRNYGQSEIEFAELGVFAAVRDPDNKNRSFGFIYKNKTLAVGETVAFNSSRKLDKPGTWKIWPSFQIRLATGKKLGPEEWHAALIEVEDLLYPDLIITEVKCDWRNNSIGYVIKNKGEGEAKSGYYVSLYVDGEEVDRDYVNISLNPGQTYESWFKQYQWPEGQDLNVTVCVDAGNSIKESNESNNCLEALCKRQFEPIAITSGPSVVNVTHDSVLIVWTTNVASSSLVNYSSRSSGFTGSVFDSKPVKNHSILLTGLKSATTYRYFVESVEWRGRIRSPTITFETKPPLDDEKPKVKLLLPEMLRGVVEIEADASDNIGVSRVSFSIDGVVKFIDFSPPYIWMLDTSLYENGLHSFTATAYDLSGNKGSSTSNGNIENLLDTRPPVISITNPPDGGEVFGVVEVEALISEIAPVGESTGYITQAELHIDGNLLKRWVYTPVRHDFLSGELVPNPRTSSLTLTYLWDTSHLTSGSTHTIEVFAWDNSENHGSATASVTKITVEYAPPPLTIEYVDILVDREVERVGNYFRVTLSVTNTGTKTLQNFQIVDKVRGFQGIPQTDFTQAFYVPELQTTILFMAPHPEATLSPGKVGIFQYLIVPILCHPTLSAEEYVIGTYTSVSASTTDSSYRYMFTVDLPYAPSLVDEDGDGLNELDDAFKNANFLIVTNPSRLYGCGSESERRAAVNNLLCRAARLATIKRGVLGYLGATSTKEQFKALISPGGEWANKLSYAFTTPMPEMNLDAYLLIIGETEIVPSYTYEDAGGEGPVSLSDNYFADTVGNDGIPDLIVGRIIGRNGLVDGSSALLRPIEASIDVAFGHGFDTNFAVALAGYEESDDDPFVPKTNDVIGDLEELGYEGRNIYWSDFVEREWNIDFREGDAFALGDIDGDGVEEVIVAIPRAGGFIHIYASTGIYRGSFPCRFTSSSGLAAGDLDGDDVDEIVVALNDGDEDMLYVYRSDGALLASEDIFFDDWDAIAIGNLVGQYDGQYRNEIAIAHNSYDYISVYYLKQDGDSWQLMYQDCFDLPFDFSRYDGFDIGNVRESEDDRWGLDEIVIVSDDRDIIYIIDIYADSHEEIHVRATEEVSRVIKGASDEVDVRFTPYDGLALGDVDGNGQDDIVVMIDEDDAIYRYYWNDTHWKLAKMYSRFFDTWFEGIRYSSGHGRNDGFDIGKVVANDNPKMIILRNRDGTTSSYYELASTWGDADILANKRLGELSPWVSIVIVYGHGNPHGASPMWSSLRNEWNYFEKHPLVYSFGCTSGFYEPHGDYCFGEALFEKGAAVFIASTELVGMGKASWTIENIFDSSYECRWNLDIMSAGKAFTLYERDRAREGWINWVCEWNYYGDPTFPRGG